MNVKIFLVGLFATLVASEYVCYNSADCPNNCICNNPLGISNGGVCVASNGDTC